LSPARILSLLVLVAVAGCNNNTGSAVSFAFNRPERLDFACLSQYAATGTNPALIGTWTELPRACCTLYDPSNYHVNEVDPGPRQEPYSDQATAPYCLRKNDQPLKGPVLHALVTQSTRGEVAAVDLVANRVLDSDRQVPGFTFLDSGGLPTAIVVPPFQPKGDGTTGPSFVYVASAEENAVRAIPSCRFRNGSVCGPDRAAANQSDPSAYLARLRVPLPGAPADMILGPDQALWVTIPRARTEDGSEIGGIVRIALPEAGVTDDAFAIDATTRLPRRQWFGVAAMQDLPMDEPVVDSADYRTSCGLRYAYSPTSFTLPLAPRADVRASAEPDHFRYDAESGLLLVSDRGSPGVHVFRMTLDGSLSSLGALRTGQPLRELVITPRVPSSALSGVAMLARTVPADDPASETKRYLYAIDALGTVAVFDFVADDAGGLPTLTPLLAPVPDLTQMRYADRISLPTPSQSLAVIDTRSQSEYVCGQESIDDLRARRAAITRAPRPLSQALTRELSRVEARIAIHDTADTDYLRGVFVSVVSTAGRLALIDVHDLDTACRAQKFCCAGDGAAGGVNGVPPACAEDKTGARLNEPRSTDAQQSLSVRRHTEHRRTAGPQTAELATSSSLAPQVCDPSDPHASVSLPSQVCAPADTYTQLSENWRVDYQGALPAGAMEYAHWEAVPDDELRLTLVAPAEFDLCARGVEPGDLVAVMGRAPDGLRGRCPDPSADSAALFEIREARHDRLVVEPILEPLAGETQEALGARRLAVRQRALECYPDYVGVELRAGGFLVLGSGGSYLHRVITAMDGSCITDTMQDPLFNSRVRQGTIIPSPGEPPRAAEVFRNPFVSFALAPVAGNGVLPETRETTVSVSRASIPFYLDTVNTGDQVTDALPSTLQYLPEAGYLFLLDTAGQGLRRYTLRPFEREEAVFR
jgi:hypothetical protein